VGADWVPAIGASAGCASGGWPVVGASSAMRKLWIVSERGGDSMRVFRRVPQLSSSGPSFVDLAWVCVEVVFSHQHATGLLGRFAAVPPHFPRLHEAHVADGGPLLIATVPLDVRLGFAVFDAGPDEMSQAGRDFLEHLGLHWVHNFQ
jgi:hypothetical protein